MEKTKIWKNLKIYAGTRIISKDELITFPELRERSNSISTDFHEFWGIPVIRLRFSKSGLDRSFYYFSGSNVDQIGVPDFEGLVLGAQKELEQKFQYVSYRIDPKIMFNTL